MADDDDDGTELVLAILIAIMTWADGTTRIPVDVRAKTRIISYDSDRSATKHHGKDD